MARRSDRFGQYTADEPRSSTPVVTDYSWEAPGRRPPPQARQVTWGSVFGAAGGGGGGGGGGPSTPQKDPLAPTTGDLIRRRWEASQERGDRIRGSLAGRSWGHPQDYEDVLAGGRGGDMHKVWTRNPQPGLLGQEPQGGNGLTGVGAPPRPNPGGLSGGAAEQVPAATANRTCRARGSRARRGVGTGATTPSGDRSGFYGDLVDGAGNENWTSRGRPQRFARGLGLLRGVEEHDAQAVRAFVHEGRSLKAVLGFGGGNHDFIEHFGRCLRVMRREVDLHDESVSHFCAPLRASGRSPCAEATPFPLLPTPTPSRKPSYDREAVHS